MYRTCWWGGVATGWGGVAARLGWPGGGGDVDVVAASWGRAGVTL